MGQVLGVAMVAGGVLVAHTDVGPWLAPTLVASGCATIASGEPQIDSGVGITYQDDWKYPVPYIGKDGNTVTNYINQKNEYNKKIVDGFKEKKDIFNNGGYFTECYDTKSIFKVNIDLLHKFDSKEIEKFRFNSKCWWFSLDKPKPYELSKYNVNNLNKYIFNNETKFGFTTFRNFIWNVYDDINKTKNNSNNEVTTIYVIRRKLDNVPFYFGWLAHSGLLVETNNKDYYICEYGVEKNPNNVSLTKIDDKELIKKLIVDGNCGEFKMNSHTWNKQIYGDYLTGRNISPEDIKQTMMEKTKKHYYSVLFWNCHMAQESTRESYDLKVIDKYFEKIKNMYEEEWWIHH